MIRGPKANAMWISQEPSSKGMKRPSIQKADNEIDMNTAFDMSDLIFYKGKRFLSTKIMQLFEKDYEEQTQLLIKRASARQTLIPSKLDKVT